MNQDSLLKIDLDSLEFLFDRETLFVRRVRWNGVEVIRAIYAAVRDRNWETIAPVLKSFTRRDEPSGSVIELAAECVAGEIDYTYTVKLQANRNELHFAFEGTARNSFWKNRIGICVLHPIALCAGLACEIKHTSGEVALGRFPSAISALQPFLNIQGIQHPVGEGESVEITFEGDIFEMEDQRNWTDASFKTYCTPLDLPFPAIAREGEKVRQAVGVKFTGKKESRFPRKKESPSVLRVDFARLIQKARVGLGTPSPLAKPTDQIMKKLRALEIDHLRVDCSGGEPLRIADDLAASIGAGLHLAVFLQNDRRKELQEVADFCQTLQATVKMWLIHDKDRECTSPKSLQFAKEILGPISVAARFAAGTDAYFAELNREHPPATADWHPCFSINPQVHAKDNLTLVENLEAQQAVARGAASFANGAVVISPVTLLPRYNPDATVSNTAASKYDPRQKTLFAAGWTLGSLAALSAAGAAFSLTYYETTGPGGVMSDEGQIYPVYHVFRGLSKMRDLAASQIEGEDSVFSCFAGMEKDGRKVVWLANHTQKSQSLEIASVGTRFKLKVLTTSAPPAAESDPEEWWSAGFEERSAAVPLVLPALALARLELS